MHNDDNDKHIVIQAIKDLTIKLGRIPTRDEFRSATNLESKMRKQFFAYSVALQAAGMSKYSGTHVDSNKVLPVKKNKEIKYKTAQLQGHTVHEYDLDQIFEDYGNPKSIKILGQSDTHIPNEDKKALSCFLKFTEWYKPDVEIIGGDLADMQAMSHWPSDDAKPRRWKDDRQALRDFMFKKVQAIGDRCTRRFFLEGNHELWLSQALAMKVPEFYDGLEEELSLQKQLYLEELNYQFLSCNSFLKIGKLYFTHGIYTAANHPEVHLNKLKCNILYFHLHDIKSTNQTSIDGGMIAASGGCLCRLDAKFLKGKPNNWVHSFHVVEMFRDGTFSHIMPQIHNGKLSYAGQVFEGD